MITPNDLIVKFKYALANHWGYIWGRAGSTWTRADQDKATDETIREYGRQWIGRKVADCSGLFSWAFKQLGGYMYHGSNTMAKKYCTKLCQMSEGTPKPGCAVFKVRDGGDFYHVGLYIGAGKVIEAKGTRYGVVQTSLKGWDAYGYLKGVDYENTSEKKEEEAPMAAGTAVVDVPNDGTVNVREKPSASAKILGTLREGASVEVIQDNGEWAEVSFTETGYIMSKFLKKANA